LLRAVEYGRVPNGLVSYSSYLDRAA